MNFGFSKDVSVAAIEMIEKSKHLFVIKMKSRFISLKEIFEEFISKKNLISKLENTRAKLEKRIRVLKSLIKNLYKVFSRIIKHAQ